MTREQGDGEGAVREGREGPGFLLHLSEHAQYHVDSRISAVSASVAKRTPLVIHAVLTGGRNHFGD